MGQCTCGRCFCQTCGQRVVTTGSLVRSRSSLCAQRLGSERLCSCTAGAARMRPADPLAHGGPQALRGLVSAFMGCPDFCIGAAIFSPHAELLRAVELAVNRLMGRYVWAGQVSPAAPPPARAARYPEHRRDSREEGGPRGCSLPWPCVQPQSAHVSAACRPSVHAPAAARLTCGAGTRSRLSAADGRAEQHARRGCQAPRDVGAVPGLARSRPARRAAW